MDEVLEMALPDTRSTVSVSGPDQSSRIIRAPGLYSGLIHNSRTRHQSGKEYSSMMLYVGPCQSYNNTSESDIPNFDEFVFLPFSTDSC